MSNMCVLRVLAVMALLCAGNAVQSLGKSLTDSLFIERLLAEESQKRHGGSLPLYFASKFLNTPYVAHTLEVNKREQLVVNTRQLDCATLVDNVVALCMCVKQKKHEYTAFKQNLQTIRYRNGVIDGYCSRLHYFSEWINDNKKKGIVETIEQPVDVFSSIQTVNVSFMSQHAHKYETLAIHPELVSEIIRTEQIISGENVRYIGKDDIKNDSLSRSAIHDGDIIAITTNTKGLDIAHVGFAVWQKDGLHLLNASLLHKKVVLESMTLKQYLGQHPSHTGIRVMRILCD